MRKIFIAVDTGTVGTKEHYFVIVSDNMTDKELNDLSYEYALQNAETYGIYPPNLDGEYETEEDMLEADDTISGWWAPYDAEKHDMYTCSGVPQFEDLT